MCVWAPSGWYTFSVLTSLTPIRNCGGYWYSTEAPKSSPASTPLAWAGVFQHPLVTHSQERNLSTLAPAIADKSTGGQKQKNPNFADLSKELGLGSVKNGRSISKRAPGPDYRADSWSLRSESDISKFLHYISLQGGYPPRGVQTLKCYFLASESMNRDDNPAPELSSICCGGLAPRPPWVFPLPFCRLPVRSHCSLMPGFSVPQVLAGAEVASSRRGARRNGGKSGAAQHGTLGMWGRALLTS